jgi:hypothetical protein
MERVLGGTYGLRDDLEPGLVVEQQPQAAAYDRVIIGGDDPDRLGGWWPALPGGVVRIGLIVRHRRDGIASSTRW